MGQALLVRQWSADVVFFPHTLELAGDERERLTARGVGIVDGVIKRLVVDGDGLRAVELVGGQVAPRSAVFVAPHMVAHDGLLTDLGCTKDAEVAHAVEHHRTAHASSRPAG